MIFPVPNKDGSFGEGPVVSSEASEVGMIFPTPTPAGEFVPCESAPASLTMIFPTPTNGEFLPIAAPEIPAATAAAASGGALVKAAAELEVAK